MKTKWHRFMVALVVDTFMCVRVCVYDARCVRVRRAAFIYAAVTRCDDLHYRQCRLHCSHSNDD